MSNELSKKYGLFTAISMVIGIVIGSGVFFKAEKVLTATGGDMKTAILAWLLGGLIMIICALGYMRGDVRRGDIKIRFKKISKGASLCENPLIVEIKKIL